MLKFENYIVLLADKNKEKIKRKREKKSLYIYNFTD